MGFTEGPVRFRDCLAATGVGFLTTDKSTCGRAVVVAGVESAQLDIEVFIGRGVKGSVDGAGGLLTDAAAV